MAQQRPPGRYPVEIRERAVRRIIEAQRWGLPSDGSIPG